MRDPEQAGAALEFAFAEAALRRATLLAVHAVPWSPPPLVTLAKLTADQRAAVESPGHQADLVTRLDSVLAFWRHKHPDVAGSWEVVYAHPAGCSPAPRLAPTWWSWGAFPRT